MKCEYENESCENVDCNKCDFFEEVFGAGQQTDKGKCPICGKPLTKTEIGFNPKAPEYYKCDCQEEVMSKSRIRRLAVQKPEWTFTNPEDRTVQPKKPVCTTCGDSGRALRSISGSMQDPQEIPCPDCQKQEEVIKSAFDAWDSYTYVMGKFSEDHVYSVQDVVYCMNIEKEKQQSRITELEECSRLMKDILLTQTRKITELRRQNKGFQEQYFEDEKRITELDKGVNNLTQIITELEQQNKIMRDALTKTRDTLNDGKATEDTYFSLWVNLGEILAQLTADNRQEDE